MELSKQEMELSKQEMELSKQEMELTKQEMELFLLFSYLGTKNSFYKMFCIFTKDSKASIWNRKWNYPNRKWNYLK